MNPSPNRERSSWLIIVNPVSAEGRTGRRWGKTVEILRLHLPSFDVLFTAGPGQATELARWAVEQGYRTVAVHGGDGTVNEVINGLVSHPSADGPLLALLPSGTGADLVRSLGISHDLARAAVQAAGGNVRSVDVCLAEFKDLEGKSGRRYGLNVTDIGFGGELVRYVNSHSKRLGGRISFFFGLLATLFRYSNKDIRMTLDDRPFFETKASSIVIANGQYFGGGMWVAPGARLDDGRLEVVVIGDVSRAEVLTNIPRLYRVPWRNTPRSGPSRPPPFFWNRGKRSLLIWTVSWWGGCRFGS